MIKYKVVMTGGSLGPALERIQEVCEVKQWDKAGSIPR